RYNHYWHTRLIYNHRKTAFRSAALRDRTLPTKVGTLTNIVWGDLASCGGAMAAKKKADQQTDDHDGFAERAADGILGPNPFVGFSRQDVLRVIGWIAEQALKRPMALAENQVAFFSELVRILAGQSELAPEKGDKRFQDSTWKDNPFYRVW